MEKLLIFLVIAIVAIAIVQLVRVYELASKMKGGKVEETITKSENKLNGNLFIVFMIAFFGSIIWMMIEYGNGGLGEAASVHGLKIDSLLTLNWWIILPVFFLTNTILFVFIRMYLHDPNRKALYFSHSNKLELLWTIVPSLVLAVIVITGLKTWIDIMNPDEKGTIIEVYGEQFKWTARYAGEDNKLGRADYKLITGENPLGVITQGFIEGAYASIDKKISNIETKLGENKVGNEYTLPDDKVKEMTDKLESLKRQRYRIEGGIDKGIETSVFKMAENDIVVQELHLIKDQTYTFQFRSKDIIHSAWFPYFRAQMNVVPGMITNFTFTPNKTTKEARLEDFVIDHYHKINEIHNERRRSLGEEDEIVDFNFVLMCNKICGASHYNMQMPVIVETEDEFKTWVESQTQVNGDTVKYWGAPEVVENK